MHPIENTKTANIKVRNLEPWVVPVLLQQAEQAGHKSLEGFVRQLLQEQALRPQNDISKEVQEHLKKMTDRYGLFPDGFTEELVRDIREEQE